MPTPVWAACALALTMPAASAGDWPQILGPARTGIAAADERLADRWPESGPREIWRRDVGAGHAGVAVVAGRVILFHRLADREVVEALDAATGQPVWKADHATNFMPQVGGGDGPLCVPVVHGRRVIVFGAQGVLDCLDAGTGERLWMRETHREFGAQEGYFGAGSTPLVVGDHVIVNVGGAKRGAGVVAFSLATGETVWQATAEPATYAAPVAVAVGGEPHVLIVTRYACLLLDPVTGAVRWRFPFGQRGPTVNAATPVVPAAGRLFVTAAYGIGCVCADFDRTAATPKWEGPGPLATQYCTPIVDGGHLYGIDGRDDVPPADLVCIEAEGGREVWRERGFGYGTLLAADGKLLAAKTDGELMLLQATPAAVAVLARGRPLPGTLRALPALAEGRLYVRDDSTLTCLDVGR
ncbi:Pyrrolo-quinoline quinone [bacterium]|nr:Pyrrolo-quinoline quinone [bacterium]